jgi:N-acetylglucosaminyl-diphospho-decaprenol L-rhamnosyltransferase
VSTGDSEQPVGERRRAAARKASPRRRRAVATSAATAGEPAAPLVSAIVVNYNSGDLLRRCVESLRAAGVEDVVVVDNASFDGSAEGLGSGDPALRLVRAGSNLGYGAGANLGARSARGETLLICNPDLDLEPEAVKILSAALAEHDEVAVVGPQILTPEGERYPSARSFPTLVESLGHGFVGLFSEDNPWTRRYKHLDLEPTESCGVDWVSGACALVRREAFESVGGFDEAYFMYVEDVDLCWRLRRAGWSVLYEPAAVVTHVQGASTALHRYRMLAAHHRSMWRFARLTSRGRERLALPLVAAGLAARLAVSSGKLALAGRRGGGETGSEGTPTKV